MSWRIGVIESQNVALRQEDRFEDSSGLGGAAHLLQVESEL